MAVSKLGTAEKAEMVRLYRETPASFSQLAKQFGISVSTVSRFLQEAIPEEEYRHLVSYKQSRRPKRSGTVSPCGTVPKPPCTTSPVGTDQPHPTPSR